MNHLGSCRDHLCAEQGLVKPLLAAIEKNNITLDSQQAKTLVKFLHTSLPLTGQDRLDKTSYQAIEANFNIFFASVKSVDSLNHCRTAYFDYVSKNARHCGSWIVFTGFCSLKSLIISVKTMGKALSFLHQLLPKPKEGDETKKRLDDALEILTPLLLGSNPILNSNTDDIEHLIQQVKKAPEDYLWEKGFSFLSPIKNYPEAYFNHVSNCNKSCGFWTLFKKFTEHSQDSQPLPPATILSAQKALRRIKHIPFKTDVKKYCVTEGNKILTWHISKQDDPSDRENLSLDAIDAMARLISGRSIYKEIEPTKILSAIKLTTKLDSRLKENALTLHFERRIKYMIHLFAFLWEDQGTFRLSCTPFTYGVIAQEEIPQNHHRCHSAIVASIDRKGPEDNASWQLARGGLFLGNKIIHRLNHTVVLPKECNTVDGMIEGKNENLKGGMRPLIFEQLELVAKKDSLHPADAIGQFVQDLTARLQMLQKKFIEETLAVNYIDAHLNFLNQLNIESFFLSCLQECSLVSTGNIQQDWISLRKFLREEKM